MQSRVANFFFRKRGPPESAARSAELAGAVALRHFQRRYRLDNNAREKSSPRMFAGKTNNIF